jgi:TRAP-type mannitol/chloroaromatic compound transport system permease small subunit
MKTLIGLAQGVDRISTAIGRWASWLIVAAAVICAINAVVRKLLDWSSNALLDSQWWLFALAFLLAAPWTLAVNEHIRIDVVNSRFSTRTRNVIEVIGHVFFLLPTAAMVAYTSLGYFSTSYAQNEQAFNAGGLPQWPIKALIPAAFALLFLQGLAELIKRIAIMRGELEEQATVNSYQEIAAAAGAELPDHDPSAGGKA